MDLTVEKFAEILRGLSHSKAKAGDGKALGRIEQRSGARYQVMVRQVLVHQNAKPLRVWLRDFSASGIGFCATAPFGVGEGFSLELPTATGAPMQISCITVHCKEMGSKVFIIGARFIDRWIDDPQLVK